ncbi:restriction endonuclease [Embleya sp. NPDC050493]|uniref:restriction endonuclease n=1 Tax=Embleya sp. NPDC050493 TaxID=3363989 RepID=UPI0037929C50
MINNVAAQSGSDLGAVDLSVGTIYLGDPRGTMSEEPIYELVGTANEGGFRPRKVACGDDKWAYVALCSTGKEADWPDDVDDRTGICIYHGDNRTPGKDLHDTPLGGNALLRTVFADVEAGRRSRIPPFLLFQRTGAGRDVRFRGLLAPGTDSLLAPHRTAPLRHRIVSTPTGSFVNYEATFTVLDVPVVPRAWLDRLYAGTAVPADAPSAWREWIETGRRRPLVPTPVRSPRELREHRHATDPASTALLDVVGEYFRGDPYRFERWALEIWAEIDSNVDPHTLDITMRNGRSESTGRYFVGPEMRRTPMRFAFVADNGGKPVRTAAVHRLLARLHQAAFAVLVTTSQLDKNAYAEARAAAQPLVLICGDDIVDLLRSHGMTTPDDVRMWLDRSHPAGG